MKKLETNEFSGWREKLDSLTSLPGERMPDHAMLWEKLEARLTKAPVKKQFPWHWIAAACLALAVLLPVIRYGNKPGRSTEVVTKQPVSDESSEVRN